MYRTTNKIMKEKILELRSQGKTYSQIQTILNCSRGTISYHCGKNQKEKHQIRQTKYRRSTKSKILKKIDLFVSRTSDKKLKYLKRDLNHEKIYDKIINNPICYLTGRKIDLSKSETYNLDHIIPYSQSGNCSIDNMGLTCKEANHSKSYLTVEEYIQLCKEVLEFNNYKVTRV